MSELLKRIITSIIIVPICLFFIIEGSVTLIFFIIIFFFIISYEWYQLSKKKKYFFPGIVFFLFSCVTVYLLREEDLKFFLLILLICVSSDIGGYIFGKILKGPKLTKISPNKTYAGMFGGFLLSVIFTNIFLNNLVSFNLSFKNEKVDTITEVSLILIVSFISQLGDILISHFKRKSKVKNTGKLLPGHGGLLDRVDGIIFAIPSVYIINLIYIFLLK